MRPSYIALIASFALLIGCGGGSGGGAAINPPTAPLLRILQRGDRWTYVETVRTGGETVSTREESQRVDSVTYQGRNRLAILVSDETGPVDRYVFEQDVTQRDVVVFGSILPDGTEIARDRYIYLPGQFREGRNVHVNGIVMNLEELEYVRVGSGRLLSWRATYDQTATGGTKGTYWIAPSIGAIVKSVVESADGGTVTTRELSDHFIAQTTA